MEFHAISGFGIPSYDMELSFGEHKIATLSSADIVKCKIYSTGKLTLTGQYRATLADVGPPRNFEFTTEAGKTYFLNISMSDKRLIYLLPDDKVAKAVEKAEKNPKLLHFTEDIDDPIGSMAYGPKSGTGFLVSSSGYIATNYHVIENAKKITVKGINGSFFTSYKASIVLTDKNNDLALVKLDDPSIKFDSIPYEIVSSQADVGQNIYILGYPLTTTMGEEVKMTNGTVSSRSGYEGNITSYQISAPAQPGNSGGPLIDQNGNVIGIVNAKHLGVENVTYAVKAAYLKTLLEMSPEPPKACHNKLKNLSTVDQIKVLKNYTYIIDVNKN